MPELGSLWYSVGLKDLTDADIKKINEKLKNLGSDLLINPKLAKSVTEILPKGIKLELEPQLKAVSNEALAKAVEGKVMKVEIAPLLTNLRKALKDATKDNPPEVEVGVQSAKLRTIIQNVLNKQGFMLNISTVNDNYSKVVQQKLNGTRYTVRIHADAKEITRSVQASLMQVQSRAFGLQISRDILYRSIDDALGHKRFIINVAVQHDQARKAVQDALLRAQVIGKDQALAYQRLQTGELKAAQAELARLKAAHMGAADAAKAHATASINLGGALGSNIKIAGELSSAMASLYSVHAAKEFLSQVIEIGGELEHQKIAMDTIFGDKGKTSELFGQIKGLARQSPFGAMELTKSVKALSAYGVQYNEIYDTAKRLADISAATSVDINRLILAFGKTKSRGFLDGLEAKQFAYANIPIYEMVRRKLEELEGQAVTTAQVMERMKKREIGFDIVKDVLWDMTDEGGKFYNMQEALAGSVKTSWKLVRDNIELMFGEIAESSVGGALKDVAETLQVLTRNWRAMGTMIGASAAAFGVYKVAVAASNAMIGQANALALQKATASNKVAAANAMEAASYRVLTQAEDYAILAKSGLAKLNRSLLLSHRALTEAEWDAVLASKAVSNDYILRRIALGRLTQAEIDYLISIEAVSAAEVQTAMRAQGLKVSLASLYATMKAGAASAWASISMQKLNFASFSASIRNAFANALTWIRTLPTRIAHAEVSVTRLKLAFSGLGRAMSSIGAFLLNPVTIAMAAIGGLMYAWEKNNEEMQKAKEIGDNLFTKATEGADNLKKTLADIKPSAELSNHELLQGIEQMEQAIKDYSPTPIKDINDALYTQEGLLRPIADRYDELKKKVEELKGAFDSMESGNLGNAVENAINDTNKGLFNDDINTNAKDYAASLKKQSDSIRQFLMNNAKDAREAVKEAIDISSNFAASVKDMNTQQAFMELVKNWDSYKNEFERNSKVAITVGVADDDSSIKIKEDLSKLLDDMQIFWDSIRTDAQNNGIDAIEDATEEVKKGYAISIKNWIQGLEVSDDVKQMMFAYYSNLLKFDFETFNATAQIADSLNQGLEAEVGTAIFHKVKNGIKLTDDEQQQVMDAFEKIYNKLFEKLPDIQKEAFNKAVANKGENGEWVYDSGKKMRIQASLNVRANWQEWQREIDDATGNLKPIQTWVKGASDIPSFIKAAQEGYKEAKTTIDKLKPLMLKAGFEFEFGELLPQGTPSTWYMGLSDMEKQMVDQYNAQIRILKAAQKAGKEYGFDPAEEYNKGKKGTPKDEFAEAVKERIRLLKKAKSEYESLAKSIGREAASKELADSPIFAGLKANSFLPEQAIPKSLDEYEKTLDELQEKLTAKGLKSKKHRELNVEIEQVKFDIKKARVDEQLKLALDKVSKEAERQLADWNLFDKIRKATGNQDLAMSIAFGMNATSETDYPAMIKQQLQKTVEAAESALSKAIPKEGESPYKVQGYTYDKLKELYDARDTDKGMQEWVAVPEEIRKAWEKANGDILKYFDQQRESVANILNEYQTLQDKISAINAKRNLALETINAKNERGEYILSDEERAKRASVVNTQADYDIFTQSNDYLRFFNDIYGLTMDEANRIGDLIQLNLNRKLQDGLITIYDYEQQMEKVRKQLEALRNVKSDAMTFLTGGLKGLNQKKLQKAEGELANNADYQKALKEQIAAQNALNKAREEGNEEAIEAAEAQLALANQSVKVFTKIRDAIIADQEKMQNILDVTNIAANIAGGMSDAFNTLRDMADSFGFDTESNAWETAAAVMDTLTTVTSGVSKVVQSAMNGDIGGVISGIFDTLLTPFTIWNKLHDKKLQKDIELSKRRFNQYDRLVTAIERKLNDHLGGYVDFDPMPGTDYGKDGAFGYERDMKKAQLEELKRQQADMEAMKKKDPEAIEDIKAQISELTDEIANLEIEAANALYGIDIKGYAETIGDALWDAFMKGEDAAEAFDKAVADIMSNVVKNILKVNILERAFQRTKDWLASEDGPMNDGILTTEEAKELGQMLYEDGKKGMKNWNTAMSAMPEELVEMWKAEYTNQKSGLSAGIQSVTEDTADLLASYLNAIRADVAMQTGSYWTRLLDDSLPQMNIIAQSQLDTQRQIAENTLRNAVAAETIVQYSKSIDDRLRRAQADKSTGFWMR